VAWSLGVPDGTGLGAERAAAVIARIVAAIDVPVSADIEPGYQDVAATVTAVLQAGAVGVNIEDRRDGSGLYAPTEQADRLAAGPLPVAVMVWPGAPSVAELAAAGAVRISLGSAIA
jgi:2-methylisocitrate lyase-like PEP mutase family enzyme